MADRLSALVRPIASEEAGVARPLFEELAEQFDDRAAFEAWREGTLASFYTGFAGMVGLYEGDTLAGGILYQGQGGFRVLLASLGTISEAGLAAGFDWLRERSRMLVWDESVGPDWVTRLADRGARPYVRQTFVQALAEVAFPPVPQDDLRLVPWTDEAWHDAGVSVLAAACAETLNGVFLTLPQAPTLEACAEKFRFALAGYYGPFLPWASFLAFEGETVVGALLCIQGEHAKQGMLYELGVAPAARGRQLSRRLVQAMQRALLEAGYEENHFLTTAENAAVQRLFRPEEICRYEEARGGYWVGA